MESQERKRGREIGKWRERSEKERENRRTGPEACDGIGTVEIIEGIHGQRQDGAMGNWGP